MTRRREVLKAAAVAAVMAGPSIAVAKPARPAITAVIYDPSFADSEAFARALEQNGARLFSTATDVGTLWRGPLGEVLAAGGQVAGLTANTDFFIAGVFAREAHKRVLFEGAHDGRGAGVRHTLKSAGGLDAQFANSAAWPGALAMALAARPTDRSARHGVLDAHTRAAGCPSLLCSWVVG